MNLSTDDPRKVPAQQFMVLDVLKQILEFALSPAEMGRYLTQQVRELVGARSVVLAQVLPDHAPVMLQLMSVEPLRMGPFVDEARLREMLLKCQDQRTACWMDADRKDLGRTSLVMPLDVGPERVGGLFCLDLMDVNNRDEISDLIQSLAPVVALILRNCMFYDRQAQEAEQHARKLEAQLAQAQRLESVGRLAGGIAHDINNMLTVVLGHVELMKISLEPGHPFLKHMGEMLKATDRSRDIIRQLLAFSRQQTIELECVDINIHLAELYGTLASLIGEDIEMSFLPGHQLGLIRADSTQLTQVVMNLVVNARDAMPEGGKLWIETLRLEVEESASSPMEGAWPGVYAAIQVRDTGSGMSREVMEHIFEPFFSTKGIDHGTGLGLATLFGIVRQHKGFVRVESEVGKGSVFTVALPVDEENQPAPAVAVPDVQQGHGCVLLVEDDPLIRDVAPIMLKKLGFECLVADGAESALAFVNDPNNLISLLFTDVIMPEVNGKALRDMIWQVRPGLPCLFMSGYTSDVIARRGLVDGSVPFLQKPFTLQELGEKLKEII